MTHGERIDHLVESLGKRGVKKYTVGPPLYRLFWRLGWNVRPPLFQGFMTAFLTMGTVFGVVFGLLMWLMWRLAAQPDPAVLAFTVSVTGAVFGLSMAVYYRRKKRTLGLPEWERYPDA